jgi:hypothetical protein
MLEQLILADQVVRLAVMASRLSASFTISRLSLARLSRCDLTSVISYPWNGSAMPNDRLHKINYALQPPGASRSRDKKMPFSLTERHHAARPSF